MHGATALLSVVKLVGARTFGSSETLANGRNGRMSTLLNDFKIALRKRAAYNRTVRDISEMPLDTAVDLDLYQGDARKIARRAVYG